MIIRACPIHLTPIQWLPIDRHEIPLCHECKGPVDEWTVYDTERDLILVSGCRVDEEWMSKKQPWEERGLGELFIQENPPWNARLVAEIEQLLKQEGAVE